ncbi:MAG: class II aldolase/adducin family protein [Bacillota bacterium]
MDYTVELIQTGLNMIKSGLVKGTWGNISARRSSKMWITPSGIPYEELTPEDIAVIDIPTGSQLEGKRKPSSEMPLHRILYTHLPDIHGIVHTHSIYASAFAAVQETIPCYTEDQAQIIGGSIPAAAYALPGTEELAMHVLTVLQQDRFAALLSKHGLVAVGRSLKEAWTTAEVAEKSAQVASIIKSMHADAQPIDEDEIKMMRSIYLNSYSKQLIHSNE